MDRQRATAEELLRHNWVRMNGVRSHHALPNPVLGRIREFSAMNKFQKEALKVIASNMPTDEIEGLKQLFHSLDTDKNGTITYEEFRQVRMLGIRMCHEQVAADNAKEIIHNFMNLLTV